jgi:2-polyprenyl-6-methoxyphenol hydroxylase-like FAD-dependent oxidoreductase
MGPFGGVGGNVAMEDGLKLARAIISRKQRLFGPDVSQASIRDTLSEAIKEYEEEMFPRAKKNMVKTEQGLKMMFSEDGNGLKTFAEKKFAHALSSAKK